MENEKNYLKSINYQLSQIAQGLNRVAKALETQNGVRKEPLVSKTQSSNKKPKTEKNQNKKENVPELKTVSGITASVNDLLNDYTMIPLDTEKEPPKTTENVREHKNETVFDSADIFAEKIVPKEIAGYETENVNTETLEADISEKVEPITETEKEQEIIEDTAKENNEDVSDEPVIVIDEEDSADESDGTVPVQQEDDGNTGSVSDEKISENTEPLVQPDEPVVNSAPVQKPVVTSVEPDTKKETRFAFCPECGYEFKENAPRRFCPECGYRLQAPATVPVNTPPVEKTDAVVNTNVDTVVPDTKIPEPEHNSAEVADSINTEKDNPNEASKEWAFFKDKIKLVVEAIEEEGRVKCTIPKRNILELAVQMQDAPDGNTDTVAAVYQKLNDSRYYGISCIDNKEVELGKYNNIESAVMDFEKILLQLDFKNRKK